MRLVVTGTSGLLGSNFVARAANVGHEVVATYHRTDPGIGDERVRLDITDGQRATEVVQVHDPDAVVNCAAMTDVDGCETDSERAAAVNEEAPRALAAAASETAASFVQVSTDYVFDGTDQGRYTESDEPNPIQRYGETKLRGERATRAEAPGTLVPRLSFVYGRHGASDELIGFPAWVVDRLKGSEEVPLFVDQRVTPTRAGAAAETILSLLDRGAEGVVNVAAQSCVTPFGFGRRIAARLGASTDRLTEIDSDTLDRAAQRPANTCLDVSLVESLLDREQPTVDEDLAAVL